MMHGWKKKNFDEARLSINVRDMQWLSFPVRGHYIIMYKIMVALFKERIPVYRKKKEEKRRVFI